MSTTYKVGIRFSISTETQFDYIKAKDVRKVLAFLRDFLKNDYYKIVSIDRISKQELILCLPVITRQMLI